MDDRRIRVSIPGTSKIQGESIFWEVIVLVIVRRQVHIKMCLWTVTKIGLLESAPLTQIFVCGAGMKREVYKRKVGIPDELLARILDAAAATTMKREDQLSWTTQDLRTRAAKCTEVDGGIFEHLSWTLLDGSVTH
jgi:hypothetical protein